ncbi:MAG: hypothetical protein ACM3ZC_11630 [Bacteroidota bacterium]
MIFGQAVGAVEGDGVGEAVLMRVRASRIDSAMITVSVVAARLAVHQALPSAGWVEVMDLAGVADLPAIHPYGVAVDVQERYTDAGGK